jgi:hypothetical protein
MSNFGSPSATGKTNCELNTIIEIENGILASCSCQPVCGIHKQITDHRIRLNGLCGGSDVQNQLLRDFRHLPSEIRRIGTDPHQDRREQADNARLFGKSGGAAGHSETKRVAAPGDFARTGKSVSCFPKWSVQPHFKKYFCSGLPQISSLSRAVLSHRGACARHERGAGCGGRGSVRRCQGMAGRVDQARELTNGMQTNGAWPVEAFGRDEVLRTAKPCGSGTRCWC